MAKLVAKECGGRGPLDVYSYFKREGFTFSDETITNFFLSLRTKPFVILTGISGSGKSKIAELFAEYVIDHKEQIQFVPVKPNWTDHKYLFGYHNVLDNTYALTPLIKLLIHAKRHPQQPYFLILDEMNLAKVEHYFSDFLSCLESRKIDRDAGDALNDFDRLSEQLGDQITLSEAIILSAIDLKEAEGIDVENEQQKIETYRKNRFSEWWKERVFRGNDRNWTPQYRTELNQGADKRVASRVFEGGSGHYRLKKESELDPADNELINKLKLQYENLKAGIKQQHIILHNASQLLPTVSGEEAKEWHGEVNVDAWHDEHTNVYYIPPQLDLPLNLFVVGTVNIDETTYMFSPKVLDRANVIEFNEVNVRKLVNGEEHELEESPIHIYNEDYTLKRPVKSEINLLPMSIPHPYHSQWFYKNAFDCFKDLNRIQQTLKRFHLHFGYRVINEISYYIYNAHKYVRDIDQKIENALDIQILQKILPKFHGSVQKLWAPLVELLFTLLKPEMALEVTETPQAIDELVEKLTHGNASSVHQINNDIYTETFKYPRAAKKIVYMLNTLSHQGFVSFIE